MGFFTKIKMAFKLVGTICELAKLADNAVSERFSDEWAAELRKQAEIWLCQLYLKSDKGILSMVQFDDQFLRFAMILFKSDRLLEIAGAPDKRAREAAVVRLKEKLRSETLEYLDHRRRQNDN